MGNHDMKRASQKLANVKEFCYFCNEIYINAFAKLFEFRSINIMRNSMHNILCNYDVK